MISVRFKQGIFWSLNGYRKRKAEAFNFDLKRGKCYDLCKNVYADIKLWNVMSNSKLLFRNKIQYIWYIDIVLACKLLNFR